MQNFDILDIEGLFFLCTLLKVLKQGFNSSISLSLTIINMKVVTREFLSLTNLFEAQTLCIHELAEVFAIGKYKQLMLRAI